MKKLSKFITTSLILLFTNSCNQSESITISNELINSSSKINTSNNIKFVENQNYYSNIDNLLKIDGIKSIDIIHYNFFTENGGTPELILNHLVNLKSKGVKIRIILEGVKSDPNKRNSITIKKLKDAGITEVKLSSKKTTHDKSICINSKYLLAGSTNWTKTSMEKNNETNALVDSEIIGKAYTKYFNKLWKSDLDMYPETTNDNISSLITDNAFYPELIKIIKNAEFSLDIGTYFLAYRKGKEVEDKKVKDLLDLIIERNNILKNKGKSLKVRFFIDNNGISPEHYKNFTQRAALNARDYLLKNGITEIYFDKYEQISHCKFVIKDASTSNQEVIFGSTNLYNGDFDDHHQLNFKSSDGKLVDDFVKYMNNRLKESTKEPVIPNNQNKISTSLDIQG